MIRIVLGNPEIEKIKFYNITNFKLYNIAKEIQIFQWDVLFV